MPKQYLAELAGYATPPEKVGTALINFCNFFKLAESQNHNWTTVKICLKKFDSVMQLLNSFNFDFMTGPQTKFLKKTTILPYSDLEQVSIAGAQINEVLYRAKAYMEAK